MTTPITRSRFLATLAGLVAAPFVASRALAAAKVALAPLDLTVITIPLDSKIRYVKRPILVPSNRYLVEDVEFTRENGFHPGRSISHHYYGHWDGTLKLEAGCTNPAYVLADLSSRDECGTQWGDAAHSALYDWGFWCDQPVVNWPSMLNRTKPDPAYVWHPRHTIHTLYIAEGDLRHSLETHFKVWKATDERYRKSWPGIPYPSDSA